MKILLELLTWLVPLLPAIVLHEAAHAYAARWLGDGTAARMGRCTLNPRPHFDAYSTVMVPLFTFVVAGIAVGWAKPVHVDYYRLQKAGALVAAAGPAANLAQAGLWAAVALAWPSQMATLGVLINAALAMLNLIPVLPFDGGRIAKSLR